MYVKNIYNDTVKAKRMKNLQNTENPRLKLISTYVY